MRAPFCIFRKKNLPVSAKFSIFAVEIKEKLADRR
jgi:hypothetical protein